MMDEPAALTTSQVAELLRGVTSAIRSEVDELPEAALRRHPAPGEWCIKEVLGHFIEAEQRGFAGRIRTSPGRPTPRRPAPASRIPAGGGPAE